MRCLALCLALVVQAALADTIEGKVIRVADGDTLTIRTAQPLDYRIRISGIDAPEKGQPFGNRSKQNLAQLTLNKQARLDCYKTDRYQRKVCRVSVEGRDVGLEQVRVGAAWWYRAYVKKQTVAERREYESAEDQPKAAKLGLWHDKDSVPPWEWRHAKKSRRARRRGKLLHRACRTPHIRLKSPRPANRGGGV